MTVFPQAHGYLLRFLHRLLEQIKNPRCRAVVGVLNCAKSKSLRKWLTLVRNFILKYIDI